MKTSAKRVTCALATAALVLLGACDSPTQDGWNVAAEELGWRSVLTLGSTFDIHTTSNDDGMVRPRGFSAVDNTFGTITFTDVGADAISFDLALPGQSLSRHTVYNTNQALLLDGIYTPVFSDTPVLGLPPAVILPMPDRGLLFLLEDVSLEGARLGELYPGLEDWGIDPLRARIRIRIGPGGVEIVIEIDIDC